MQIFNGIYVTLRNIWTLQYPYICIINDIIVSICIGGDHWDGGPGVDGIHPPGQGGEALQ